MSYQEQTNQKPEIPTISDELDPKHALEQLKAPEGYNYVQGLFGEKDKTMQIAKHRRQ